MTADSAGTKRPGRPERARDAPIDAKQPCRQPTRRYRACDDASSRTSRYDPTARSKPGTSAAMFDPSERRRLESSLRGAIVRTHDFASLRGAPQSSAARIVSGPALFIRNVDVSRPSSNRDRRPRIAAGDPRRSDRARHRHDAAGAERDRRPGARALLRGDGRAAKRLCDRLRDEAGDGAPRYAGTYEHLLRLTLYLADAHVGAATAEARLNEAHATLVAEADAITDAGLKDSFLDRVAEHREIVTRFRSRAS